jgi:hypothetical protein
MGASSQSDALKKLKENPDSFVRPVVSRCARTARFRNRQHILLLPTIVLFRSRRSFMH